jgi:glycosyltransferase involved in cell wall biosynthesis
MKKFILAITTYNRINYLKDCLDSWDSTRSLQNSWTVIVADDGSSDGTLKYLQTKQFNNCDVILLQNNRIGVHQQTNTIIEKLETLPFDMCFKIDDDLLFLKEGWDILYYKTAIETNCPHLVFCDRSWSSEQLLKTPKENNTLVGSVSKLNVHGFFYTLTLPVIKTVG